MAKKQSTRWSKTWDQNMRKQTKDLPVVDQRHPGKMFLVQEENLYHLPVAVTLAGILLFGVTFAPVGDSSMVSDSWFCIEIECSVLLKFLPTATNLLNDPVAVIHVSINGIIYDLTWGISTPLLVNPGDEVFFIFDHTKNICNEAYMNIVNVTCPINYGNVMALYFGDPPCRG